MSVPAVCANGHAVKAKDTYAGQVCLCPICGVRMEVGNPKKSVLTEEAIMDILQPHESGLLGASVETPAFSEDSIMDVLQPHESGLSGLSLQIADFADEGYQCWVQAKADDVETVCAKCQQKIPDDVRTCPHCHAYVASFQD